MKLIVGAKTNEILDRDYDDWGRRGYNGAANVNVTPPATYNANATHIVGAKTDQSLDREFNRWAGHGWTR